MGVLAGQGRQSTRRETNNWHNDISTRDRSREGAEKAIDLSARFKNPNFMRVYEFRRSAPAAGESHAGTEAVSVLLPER